LAAVVFAFALLLGIGVHPVAGLVIAAIGLPFLVLGLIQRAGTARRHRGRQRPRRAAGSAAGGGLWLFGAGGSHGSDGSHGSADDGPGGGGCGGGGSGSGGCGGGGCGGGS